MVYFNSSGETKTIAVYENCVTNIVVSDPNNWGNTYSASGGVLTLTTPPNSTSAKTENVTVSYSAGTTPCSKTFEIFQFFSPIYRWVDLNPSTDYYCSGTTKYYKQQKQISYDGGTTWAYVSPASYQWGSSAETHSADCGYIPPTPQANQYFNIESNSQNISIQFSGTSAYSVDNSSIQYSLDSGTTWNALNRGSSVNLSQGNKIYFKSSTLRSPSSVYGIGRFLVTGGQYSVNGNILSLLYGDSFSGETSLAGFGDGVFYELFRDQTGLVNANNLILPSTTSNSCYSSMFYGCSNLTAAPELPATTLGISCYRYMFVNCSNLTTAPALPVTTLVNRCYEGMFMGCTSLTTAPDLSATTLAWYCYKQMFQGCTSLNYIKCLATDISATQCTDNWLYMYGVSTSGTFVKNSSMSSWPTGEDGIPDNWTVQDA